MPFSNYFLQKLIQYGLGNVPFTPPANVWLGLSSSEPTQAAGAGVWNFSEPAIGTNGYARYELANSDLVFVPAGTPLVNGFQVVVAPAVEMAESTGPWSAGVALDWFGLFDAATAGNLLGYGALTPPLTVAAAGYIPEFPAGQLTASLV